VAERSDMAYAGSFVTAGVGCGVGLASANDTEVGQISRPAAQALRAETPRHAHDPAFSRTLLQFILVLAGINLCLLVYPGPGAAGDVLTEPWALACGGHPEELPAIGDHPLAIGVAAWPAPTRSSARLPAVEPWAKHHRDLLHKTGTSTQNPDDGARDLCRRQLVALEYLWPSRSGVPTPCPTTRALQETLLSGPAFATTRPPRTRRASGGRSHRSRPAWWRPIWPASTATMPSATNPRQDAIPFRPPAPVHGHPATCSRAISLSKGRWRRCATAAGASWTLRRGDSHSMRCRRGGGRHAHGGRGA